jgi:hypothetical protein
MNNRMRNPRKNLKTLSALLAVVMVALSPASVLSQMQDIRTA